MDQVIRVAVAEDEPYLRESLCRDIAGRKNMVLTGSAATGKEIVSLVLEHDTDIVLMDIEMEAYNSGILAASAIAAGKPGMIFIFLTVHDEDELIYEAFSVAANVDYIIKSAAREKVLRKIEDVFYSRNSIDPLIMRKLTGEFHRMRSGKKHMMRFYNILFTITPSEKELIRLMLDGNSNAKIAELRGVQIVTIKSQINTLLKKFDVKRSREIVTQIREIGLESFFSS